MEPKHQTELQMRLNNGWWMRVVPLSTHTYRIRIHPSGHFTEPALSRLGILPSADLSCAYSIMNDEHAYIVHTEHSELRIDLRDGQISLFSRGAHEPLKAVFQPQNVRPAQLSIELEPSEALYGLGDGMQGSLQKRGLRAEMSIHRESPYLPIPYLMSSKGWGLFLATTLLHAFDLGLADPDRVQIDIPDSNELDFYVFAGDSYAELLNRYTDIAGKPALMPLWAFGLSFANNAQLGEREMLQEALKFRQTGIPCDRIVVNEGWSKQADDGSGRLEWDPERFGLYAGVRHKLPTFIQMLHKHGFKLGVVVNCNKTDITMDRSDAAEETDEKAARLTWYDQLESITDDGVSSYQITGGNQWVLQPQKTWANGMTDNELHNLYPVLVSKRTYDGMQAQTGLRPFVINSMAGYAGIQQFASTLSGGRHQNRDIGLISALSCGLSGHSNVSINMDLSTREGIHAGFLQPWAQVSHWSTFWNPHLLEDSLKELFRTYAKLHYRLIPYLYSAAHVAWRTGFPIVRAMPLLFPDDPECRSLPTQYMLGDSLLVAAFAQTVYLPEGIWYDYWTGQPVEGGQTIQYDVPAGAGGALLIRGGAIIPQWPEVDYVGQTHIQTIELHIYPHRQNEFTLYEDDGVSMLYKDGQIAATRIECTVTDRRTAVRIFRRTGSYNEMPLRRSYDLYVHMEDKPSKVRLNGKPCEAQKYRTRTSQRNVWHYDRHTRSVKLHVDEIPQWEKDNCLTLEFIGTAASASKQAAETAPASSSDRGDTREGIPLHTAQLDIYNALAAGDSDALKRSMRLWWSELAREEAFEPIWRLHIMRAAMFAARYVELLGWPHEHELDSDMDALFAPGLLDSPEQGLQQLVAFYQQCAVRSVEQPKHAAHPAIAELFAIIRQRIDQKLTLHEAAERIGVHPAHLSRLFRGGTGTSFSDYVMRQRMERAKLLLEFGLTIRETATVTGFAEVAYFGKMFSKYWGIEPAAVAQST
ncbi:MAG: xylS [Paenibacillus sp.]|nr:xylS [Paenibacillus sp.]